MQAMTLTIGIGLEDGLGLGLAFSRVDGGSLGDDLGFGSIGFDRIDDALASLEEDLDLRIVKDGNFSFTAELLIDPLGSLLTDHSCPGRSCRSAS